LILVGASLSFNTIVDVRCDGPFIIHNILFCRPALDSLGGIHSSAEVRHRQARATETPLIGVVNANVHRQSRPKAKVHSSFTAG
jgi:hypothetical protein